MAGIEYPAFTALKANLLTIYTAIAAEEAAVASWRNFQVTKDRWLPWVEKQQGALVNILVDSTESDNGRSGTHHFKQDSVTVHLDMYAIGKHSKDEAGDIFPADEAAALRLDLLIAQVREGFARKANHDLGFTPGTITIGTPSLQFWSIERQETTHQYAPARWSLPVTLPFIPTDQVLTSLTQLNFTFDQLLESWGVTINYPLSGKGRK